MPRMQAVKVALSATKNGDKAAVSSVESILK